MTEEEKLRADARVNRDKILEIARDKFEAEPDVSLNAIAKAAGVGPGTLYRHFPSREALVLGVYHKEIEALVALAPALTAKHPPLVAFRRWCDRLARFGRMKHGVAAALHAAMADSDFEQTYWPMVGAIEHLLHAGEASGDFVPGTDAEDILLLLGFLWRVSPDPAGEMRTKRLLELIIRGVHVR